MEKQNFPGKIFNHQSSDLHICFEICNNLLGSLQNFDSLLHAFREKLILMPLFLPLHKPI